MKYAEKLKNLLKLTDEEFDNFCDFINNPNRIDLHNPYLSRDDDPIKTRIPNSLLRLKSLCEEKMKICDSLENRELYTCINDLILKRSSSSQG